MAYTINKRKNNDHWKVTQWHLRGSHNEFWGEHMMILEGFTQWPWDDPGRIDTKTLERYTQWPWKDTQRPRKGALTLQRLTLGWFTWQPWKSVNDDLLRMQVINYMDVQNDPGKVNKMTLVDQMGELLFTWKKKCWYSTCFF